MDNSHTLLIGVQNGKATLENILAVSYIKLSTCLSYILENELASHSSILSWTILWTEEPAVHRFAQSRARLKQLNVRACISYIPVVSFLGIKPREHIFLHKDFYIASLFHNRWKLDTTQIFINVPWITNWGISYSGILFSSRKKVLIYEQLGWIPKELW